MSELRQVLKEVVDFLVDDAASSLRIRDITKGTQVETGVSIELANTSAWRFVLKARVEDALEKLPE